jgi:hypothetical protein
MRGAPVGMRAAAPSIDALVRHARAKHVASVIEYQTAERLIILVTSWPATDDHLSRARGRAAKRIDAARSAG